jgi:hypothetical protein
MKKKSRARILLDEKNIEKNKLSTLGGMFGIGDMIKPDKKSGVTAPLLSPGGGNIRSNESSIEIKDIKVSLDVDTKKTEVFISYDFNKADGSKTSIKAATIGGFTRDVWDLY